jgi:hypothetical protein
MFELAGNVVASWGEPNVVPQLHSRLRFRKPFWVGGNDDGIIQKYSHEGRLLAQIGTRGLFDSSAGTSKGKSQNASDELSFNWRGSPSIPLMVISTSPMAMGTGVWWCSTKTESSFANGGGRPPMTRREQGPEACSRVVHCVLIGNDGLVSVCHRQGDRVQVFNKIGNFQRNIWIRTGTPTLSDARGTAWRAAFSRDPQ